MDYYEKVLSCATWDNKTYEVVVHSSAHGIRKIYWSKEKVMERIPNMLVRPLPPRGRIDYANYFFKCLLAALLSPVLTGISYLFIYLTLALFFACFILFILELHENGIKSDTGSPVVDIALGTYIIKKL